LRPAPAIKGYFFEQHEIAETIRHNRRYSAGEEKEPKVLGIFLDSGGGCNLACPFCYTDARQDARHIAEDKGKLEIWKRAVLSARGFGSGAVIFAGKGEPFLDRNVLRMLEFVTETGLWGVVFTNNTKIDPDMAATLRGLNVSIIAKLGSLTPQDQDRMAGRAGAHRGIWQGLRNLMDAGFSVPRLGIDATIMKGNLEEIIRIFNFCRIAGAVPYLELLIESGRAKRLKVAGGIADEALPREDAIEFLERLRAMDEEAYGYTWAITPRLHTTAYEGCMKSNTMITVREDFSVGGCVNLVDSVPMGNLKESDLWRILSREAVARMLSDNGCAGCNML
jgi:MoaA/NifB/PqqE/SkfB family radical SAM enzyme